MNYYKQGDAANADKIKAAFEKLGYDISWPGGCANPDVVNIGVERHGVKYVVAETFEYIKDIIKTHQDYQELPLPKPHYDIKNFKPFDKVLVRFCNGANWCCALFSHYCTRGNNHFVCSGGSVGQCIPFNGNEHLLGTTNMCSEEYINW